MKKDEIWYSKKDGSHFRIEEVSETYAIGMILLEYENRCPEDRFDWGELRVIEKDLLSQTSPVQYRDEEIKAAETKLKNLRELLKQEAEIYENKRREYSDALMKCEKELVNRTNALREIADHTNLRRILKEDFKYIVAEYHDVFENTTKISNDINLKIQRDEQSCSFRFRLMQQCKTSDSNVFSTIEEVDEYLGSEHLRKLSAVYKYDYYDYHDFKNRMLRSFENFQLAPPKDLLKIVDVKIAENNKRQAERIKQSIKESQEKLLKLGVEVDA